MKRITRWNPNLPAWRASNPFWEMNRLFDESFHQLMDWEGERNAILPLDVVEEDDAYIVRASIPGIDPDALELTFTDNILTIRGESSYETEETQGRYLLRERRSGSFMRSLTFPTTVDPDQIEATCANGELTLRVPKTETARPRRIPIGGTKGARVIENRPGATVRTNGDTEGHGWAEGQAQLPPAAEVGSEGWAEGQARMSRDAQPESEGWAEGQARLPHDAEPASEGWAEVQATVSHK